MEGRSKLKIDTKEVHDTGDLRPVTHLEVESSKVKVIRSQVKPGSLSKRGPRLVAPSDEYVYKYRCKVSTITLIRCVNTQIVFPSKVKYLK